MSRLFCVVQIVLHGITCFRGVETHYIGQYAPHSAIFTHLSLLWLAEGCVEVDVVYCLYLSTFQPALWIQHPTPRDKLVMSRSGKILRCSCCTQKAGGIGPIYVFYGEGEAIRSKNRCLGFMVAKWWVQNRCLCPYCRLCIFRFHSFSQKIRIWYSNSQKPIRWLWSMQPLYCHQLAAYIITVTYGVITSSPFLYIYTSRFLKQSKLYVSYPDPSVFQGFWVLDQFFINQRPWGQGSLVASPYL